MTGAGKKKPRRGDGYPALREFVRGYLHEDFIVEHGSAAGAARAFRADASPAERRQVRRDLTALRTAAGGRTGELARLVRTQLGGAWVPASIEEVDEMIAALSGPPAA